MHPNGQRSAGIDFTQRAGLPALAVAIAWFGLVPPAWAQETDTAVPATNAADASDAPAPPAPVQARPAVAPAAAQTVDAPPAPPAPERRWYGWQNLIVDGVSIAFVFTGVPLGYVGSAGYFIGSPVVHWAHGHVGKGFGSLAMRAGVVTIAFVGAVDCLNDIADSIGSDSGSSSGTGCALMVLGTIGMIAVVPIDAFVLAHEDVEPKVARGKLLHDVAVTPFLLPTRARMALGAPDASERAESADLTDGAGVRAGFTLHARW